MLTNDRANPYRFYLLGADKRISAAAYLDAEDDAEALDIAASLHQSCSDAYPDYELWHGKRKLHARRSLWFANHKDISELQEEAQQRAVDAEERLDLNFQIAEKSPRYAAKYAELRLRFSDLGEQRTADLSHHVCYD